MRINSKDSKMQVYRALKSWKITNDFSIKKNKKYIGYMHDDGKLTICSHYWFVADKNQAKKYFKFVKNGVDNH